MMPKLWAAEKAWLDVSMNTGWKPMLLYAVAGLDGPVEMVPADLESSLDPRRAM